MTMTKKQTVKSLSNQIKRGMEHARIQGRFWPVKAWDGSHLVEGMTPYWYVLTVIQPQEEFLEDEILNLICDHSNTDVTYYPDMETGGTCREETCALCGVVL